jgi:hypothetical protein
MNADKPLTVADLIAHRDDPDPFLLDDDGVWDDPEADVEVWWARKLDDGTDIGDQS